MRKCVREGREQEGADRVRNRFCGEEVVHCNGALARTAVDDGATQLKAYTHMDNDDDDEATKSQAPSNLRRTTHQS